MKKILSPVSVILIVLAVVGAMIWGSYNRLVGLEEGVDAAWSQVENVYQRRADLIPNLIKTVEGARDFEQETLQNVVEARARVGQASIQGAPTAEQMQAFQANQEMLGGALSRLLLVVERYPDLKATEAFRDLQRQLEGAENRIAVERRRFNEVSRQYNTTRRSFPSNLVANYFGFTEKPYFQADEGTQKPPVVELSNN